MLFEPLAIQNRVLFSKDYVFLFLLPYFFIPFIELCAFKTKYYFKINYNIFLVYIATAKKSIDYYYA